jgi:hypothetical protein
MPDAGDIGFGHLPYLAQSPSFLGGLALQDVAHLGMPAQDLAFPGDPEPFGCCSSGFSFGHISLLFG